MSDYSLKEELISFVNKIKKKTDGGLDSHLCDHLLWILEDLDEKEEECSKLEQLKGESRK